MKDAMIDLETWGTGPYACLIQIGAVMFDRKTGEVGKSFKIHVNPESSMAKGCEMDVSTIKWWMNQDQAAIKSSLGDLDNSQLYALDEALILLNNFLSKCDCIWSHATFDFPIVTNLMRKCGIKPSFSFSAARDIRTLMDLAGPSVTGPERKGIHHDALDDCLHQVKYTTAALKAIVRKGDSY